MLQKADHIKNTVVSVFQHIQCLLMMNSEIAWVLVSSGTQVQRQIILDLDYLPDYLSVSYDYGTTSVCQFIFLGFQLIFHHPFYVAKSSTEINFSLH